MTLLLTLLAACSGHLNLETGEGPATTASIDAEDPDVKTPPPKKDDYFCCEKITSPTSGEGCEEILHSRVALCAKVLHCTEGHANDKGKVDCN